MKFKLDENFGNRTQKISSYSVMMCKPFGQKRFKGLQTKYCMNSVVRNNIALSLWIWISPMSFGFHPKKQGEL